MTPLFNTAVVVGGSVVAAIALVRALAWFALSRITEDSTDLDADWE